MFCVVFRSLKKTRKSVCASFTTVCNSSLTYTTNKPSHRSHTIIPLSNHHTIIIPKSHNLRIYYISTVFWGPARLKLPYKRGDFRVAVILRKVVIGPKTAEAEKETSLYSLLQRVKTIQSMGQTYMKIFASSLWRLLTPVDLHFFRTAHGEFCTAETSLLHRKSDLPLSRMFLEM